jgi:hypothetical protein
MPKTNVENGPAGFRNGKMIVANNPASEPKPTQIKTTFTQCWALGESSRSGMARKGTQERKKALRR